MEPFIYLLVGICIGFVLRTIADAFVALVRT